MPGTEAQGKFQEDRADGGGGMSLASKSLIDYVIAHRND